MKILKYLILTIPIALTFSCTDMMEDMNNDPKSITNEKLFADGVFYKLRIMNMEKNLFNLTSSWQYQVQQNLNADVFAGYTMHPGSFNSSTTNDNYNWNHGWNGWAFIVAQNNFSDFLAISSQTKEGTEYDDYYAYALILKVMTALPLVDGFGPFPYLGYGKNASPNFDNVDKVYLEGFIPELTSAINILTKYNATPLKDRVKNSGSDASSLNGDIGNWIKLANTLKLRLALRISNVNPTLASTFVQEVRNSTFGLLDKSTGDFSIDCTNPALGVNNPFKFISTAWSDCMMSADMQSFLVGFDDPRLAKYFLEASHSSVIGAGAKYAGVRPGVALTPDKGAYASYSKLNVPNSFMFVSGAESYFLLAEASLKGLGGLAPADAQTYYENGVKASFILRGLSNADAATYLSSTNTPANYLDYSAITNNYNATTTITPKWSVADGLEQIITQKWIAIFPQGAEAWAEFRRTGFPKLKVPKNMETAANFDGTIPTGTFITRMPYPANILGISEEKARAAINSYLGGTDTGAKRLWWDID